MRFSDALSGTSALLLLGALPARVLGSQILSTNGFTTCADNPTVQVTAMDVQYDKDTNTVTFDVAGTSSEVQNVTASILVTAYGKLVYNKIFEPCAAKTYVSQLCPVPAGHFAAAGSQVIPSNYASMIPSIAFSVPDLDGQAKIELKSADGTDLACIESSVGNGKSMSIASVQYVTAGIAAAALGLSVVSGIASAGAAGAAAPSPSFGEVMGFFQGVATNGMLSVSYPTVYQSFTQNFAFSTGLVSWASIQNAIDNFRQATGGNLTDNSYPYLQNVTLVRLSLIHI